MLTVLVPRAFWVVFKMEWPAILQNTQKALGTRLLCVEPFSRGDGCSEQSADRGAVRKLSGVVRVSEWRISSCMCFSYIGTPLLLKVVSSLYSEDAPARPGPGLSKAVGEWRQCSFKYVMFCQYLPFNLKNQSFFKIIATQCCSW